MLYHHPYIDPCPYTCSFITVTGAFETHSLMDPLWYIHCVSLCLYKKKPNLFVSPFGDFKMPTKQTPTVPKSHQESTFPLDGIQGRARYFANRLLRRWTYDRYASYFGGHRNNLMQQSKTTAQFGGYQIPRCYSVNNTSSISTPIISIKDRVISLMSNTLYGREPW